MQLMEAEISIFGGLYFRHLLVELNISFIFKLVEMEIYVLV